MLRVSVCHNKEIIKEKILSVKVKKFEFCLNNC